MKLYLTIPALAAAGLLSACDSNSTAAVSQSDGAISFIETVVGGERGNITADDLPDDATMNGYIAAATVNSDPEERVAEPASQTVYLGDATADFNFESGEISGSATNFNQYEVSSSDDVLSAEQGLALDGSLVIDGNMTTDTTDFYYAAEGVLSSEVEGQGTVFADVLLFGNGVVDTVDDTLTASGSGGGRVDLFSTENGDLGRTLLQNQILLQE